MLTEISLCTIDEHTQRIILLFSVDERNESEEDQIDSSTPAPLTAVRLRTGLESTVCRTRHADSAKASVDVQYNEAKERRGRLGAIHDPTRDRIPEC